MSVEIPKRTFEEIDLKESEKSAKKQRTGTQEKIIVSASDLIRDKNHKNSIGDDGLSQCFHRVRTALYVSVAPQFIDDPISGIKQQHLDQMLMTYSSALRGVVISYMRVKISDQSSVRDEVTGETLALGRIGNDTPFSFLWCIVDFVIWSPKVGDIVEGWCNMQSQSHIGLLIHDTFNATIKKFNIPSDWQFVPNQADSGDMNPEYVGEKSDENGNDESGRRGDHRFGRSLGQWMDEKGIPVEGKLKFRIRAMHLAGRAIAVEGTLVDPEHERDTQPVTLEKSKPENKHMRFDEEEKKEEKEDSEDGSDSDSDSESESDSEEDDTAAKKDKDSENSVEDESDSN